MRPTKRRAIGFPDLHAQLKMAVALTRAKCAPMSDEWAHQLVKYVRAMAELEALTASHRAELHEMATLRKRHREAEDQVAAAMAQAKTAARRELAKKLNRLNRLERERQRILVRFATSAGATPKEKR